MRTLAQRFALLEPASGAGAVELPRVVAEGRSRQCPRCSWYVMAWDTVCGNCGLAHAAISPTETVAVPSPDVRIERAATDCTAERPGEGEHVLARLAVCARPRRFRQLAHAWLGALSLGGNLARDGVDVVCSTRAVPRWQGLFDGSAFPVRLHTPRSLATRPLVDGAALVVDARASRRATSATHRAVRLGAHAFTFVRLPPSSLAAAGDVFAVTDIVAPGTFATLREARALHQYARETFLRRRDAVVRDCLSVRTADLPDEPPLGPTATTAGAAWLAIVTRERPCPGREIFTVVAHGASTLVRPGRADYDALCKRTAPEPPRGPARPDGSLDAPQGPSLPPAAIDAIVRRDAGSAARALTRELASLARAYTERVDSAPFPRRAAVAREFASRSHALLTRARLRVCITVVESVTLPDDAAP